MSDSRDMSDLEFLARRFSEWRDGAKYIAVLEPNKADYGWLFSEPCSLTTWSFTRAQWQAERKRLGLDESPAEWDGEGLPPAGTKCEYSLGASVNWFPCKVKAVCESQGAIIECDVPFCEQYVSVNGSSPARFRPLRARAQQDCYEMAALIMETADALLAELERTQ